MAKKEIGFNEAVKGIEEILRNMRKASRTSISCQRMSERQLS